MSPIVQRVMMLAADADQAQVYGPVGGPVMDDGVIALRVSLTGADGSGDPEPLKTATDASDGQASAGAVLLLVQPRPLIYDASADAWSRQRSASAATQGATTSRTGVPVAVKGGCWGIVHEPAAAVQATITRAAGGAGVRHVATGITVCLAAAAAATGPIKVRLLDGATTLWVGALSAPVSGVAVIALDDLSLVGTANTAMTLQFDGAGAAGSLETVSLSGYSTS
jgi:hypothetical protein